MICIDISQVPIDFAPMLDSIDLEQGEFRINPVQDSVVSRTQAGHACKVVGQVRKTVMDHLGRVLAKPNHAAQDVRSRTSIHAGEVGLG